MSDVTKTRNNRTVHCHIIWSMARRCCWKVDTSWTVASGHAKVKVTPMLGCNSPRNAGADSTIIDMDWPVAPNVITNALITTARFVGVLWHCLSTAQVRLVLLTITPLNTLILCRKSFIRKCRARFWKIWLEILWESKEVGNSSNMFCRKGC